MSRIFGLGETVLDVIFKNQQPVASRPGGSAFNALVSLGRAGHDVCLISELGNDLVGENIVEFLIRNNVNIDWLHRFNAGKTPVALAFLDDNNNASYQVYKDFPDERFQIDGPDFNPGDVLLFGSFFAINPSLRAQVIPLLQKARKQGAYIIYDPNFRAHHKENIKIYRPIIEENFAFAHLVRGSDEDFQTIYENLKLDEVLEKISDFDSDAIITANSQGAYCLLSGRRFHVEANDIHPLSTVGAGDNFNAGLAHAISKNGKAIEDKKHWEDAVNCALAFSTDVCLSFDNYISKEFAASL